MGKIEQCVEIICNKGCREVRADISRLEQGVELPETEGMTQDERLRVIQELKSIMSVYGDSCRI